MKNSIKMYEINGTYSYILFTKHVIYGKSFLWILDYTSCSYFSYFPNRFSANNLVHANYVMRHSI